MGSLQTASTEQCHLQRAIAAQHARHFIDRQFVGQKFSRAGHAPVPMVGFGLAGDIGISAFPSTWLVRVQRAEKDTDDDHP